MLWILEDTGLVALVHQVFVHGVGLGGRGVDGDLVLLGVTDQVGAPLEAREEGRVLPGGDDLDLGAERIVGQLEADLIVALTRGAMRDVGTLLLQRDLDLTAGDDRAREAAKPRSKRAVGSRTSTAGRSRGSSTPRRE